MGPEIMYSWSLIDNGKCSPLVHFIASSQKSHSAIRISVLASLVKDPNSTLLIEVTSSHIQGWLGITIQAKDCTDLIVCLHVVLAVLE